MQSTAYTPEIEQQQVFKRNLQNSRALSASNNQNNRGDVYEKYKDSIKDEINKKESVRKLQRVQQNVSDVSDVYEKYKNSPKGDIDKKEAFIKLQKKAQEYVKDEELKKMMDRASNIAEAKGSKAKMTIEVAKTAFEAREALNDYRSKWWFVAFALAALKDTVGDLSVFVGYMISLYLFVFLFGGGFVRKKLKKQIWKMAIIYIIGLIPVLNIIVPDAILAVYLRWRGSKKAFEKGEKDLKKIRKHYPDYKV